MKVKCLVMCTNANGEADCVPVVVECTKAEYENGKHYDAAEGICSENGYEPKFKTFDEKEFGNLARQFGLTREKLTSMVDWNEADKIWTGTEA